MRDQRECQSAITLRAERAEREEHALDYARRGTEQNTPLTTEVCEEERDMRSACDREHRTIVTSARETELTFAIIDDDHDLHE